MAKATSICFSVIAMMFLSCEKPENLQDPDENDPCQELIDQNESRIHLANYSELKNYAGDSTSVFISHCDYQGVFNLVNNCFEDGITCLIDSIGRYWHRDFSSWQLKYVPLDGTLHHFRPIYSKVQAMNYLLWVVHKNGGGVLDLEGDKIVIDRSIKIYTNTVLQNGTLERICNPARRLLQQAGQGDDYIILNDVSGLEAGQNFIIINPKSAFRYYNHQISRIESDTIYMKDGTFFQVLQESYDAESYFQHQFNMLSTIQIEENTKATINNIIFDGQLSCNNEFNHWQLNSTYSGISKTDFINCTFQNMAGENLITCGEIIKNCTGKNFAGSFIHFGCSSIENPPLSLVEGNSVSSINQIPNSIMGHSESVLTYSLNVRNAVVRDNIIKDANEYCTGYQDTDDFDNIFVNNIFENVAKGRHYAKANHSKPDQFDGNVYINVPE